MSRKFAKNCEGCYEKRPSRFRTQASRYLCTECHEEYLATGQVPEPAPVEEVEGTMEVRW